MYVCMYVSEFQNCTKFNTHTNEFAFISIFSLSTTRSSLSTFKLPTITVTTSPHHHITTYACMCTSNVTLTSALAYDPSQILPFACLSDYTHLAYKIFTLILVNTATWCSQSMVTIYLFKHLNTPHSCISARL